MAETYNCEVCGKDYQDEIYPETPSNEFYCPACKQLREIVIQNLDAPVAECFMRVEMCEKCVYYSLYQMIAGNEPYGYSGDIPCQRCTHYVVLKSEFVEKSSTNYPSN